MPDDTASTEDAAFWKKRAAVAEDDLRQLRREMAEVKGEVEKAKERIAELEEWWAGRATTTKDINRWIEEDWPRHVEAINKAGETYDTAYRAFRAFGEPRSPGRPRSTSPEQAVRIAKALKGSRREKPLSLREASEAFGVTLKAVRTIADEMKRDEQAKAERRVVIQKELAAVRARRYRQRLKTGAKELKAIGTRAKAFLEPPKKASAET